MKKILMPCNSKKSDNFLGVVRYGDHKEYYCQIDDLDSFLKDLVDSLKSCTVNYICKKYTIVKGNFPNKNSHLSLESYIYS